MKIKNINKRELKEEKKKYIKDYNRNPIILINKSTFIELAKEEDEYVERLEEIHHGIGFFYNMCYFIIDESLEDNEMEIR